MTDIRWAGVILSGGSGRRMGCSDKSGLTYRGKTFLELIGDELGSMNHNCYLSRAAYRGGDGEEHFPVIEDTVKGEDGRWIGPMGGIWSCFGQTAEDYLFFVSCDMPLFRAVMAQRLLKRVKPGVDAVLWRTRSGRIQPMCGLYSRSCVPVLKQCIDRGNYRMMAFLEQLNCVVVDTAEEHIPDSWFLNVNTPEIYARLTQAAQPVLAVSGRKNVGKTWVLEMLVKKLSGAGVRAAVIKHDGHEFEADVPGTDSYRMKKAGAIGTVVYSGSRFSMVKEQKGLEAADFFRHFPEADVILLEGQKYSAYPKIEVLRQAVSQEPVCDPETVLAYVSDTVVLQSGSPQTDGAVTEPGNPQTDGAVTEHGNPRTDGPAAHKMVIPFERGDDIMELVIGFMDRSVFA